MQKLIYPIRVRWRHKPRASAAEYAYKLLPDMEFFFMTKVSEEQDWCFCSLLLLHFGIRKLILAWRKKRHLYICTDMCTNIHMCGCVYIYIYVFHVYTFFGRILQLKMSDIQTEKAGFTNTEDKKGIKLLFLQKSLCHIKSLQSFYSSVLLFFFSF